MCLFQLLKKVHKNHFQRDGKPYQAPGRVNLIGEHTDTSEGYVMPAALDIRTVSIISPRTDSIANIYSENFQEQIHFDLRELPSAPRHHWSDYPAGVLWSLQQHGIRSGGFDMTLDGNVPIGAGLSSSASLEVAMTIAILAQEKLNLCKKEIAKFCQFAENKFIGAQSGIMDPLTSCYGVKGHAILLDCRSLEFETLPLPEEVVLVICNSMVKHSLSDGGEYNTRRAEVEEGVRILRNYYPEAHTLRDISEEQLRAVARQMPGNIFRRCLHVVTEDRRVLEAAEALRRQDFVDFGRLMLWAHASMRDNYEASCAETDLLVGLAMKQPGCYGARITGGGFGGCTVNLVAAEYAQQFTDLIGAEYSRATGIQAEIYQSRASDGAGPLE